MVRRHICPSMSAHLSTQTYQTDRLAALVFCKWSPRSQDLHVCDFFFWGYVKHKVHVPPFPQTLGELQERITEA